MNQLRSTIRVGFMLIPLSIILVIVTTCSYAEKKDQGRDSGKQDKQVFQGQNRIDFSHLFADIAEKTIPVVVSVIPTKVDTILFLNNPFYNFFGDSSAQPFDYYTPQQNAEPKKGEAKKPPLERREFRQQGLGSGVIMSNDGFILTNYHVVAGASEIQVKLADGRIFDANVKGADSLADVAVIKIKNKIDNLPVAKFGDSDKLRAGDWLLAVGNPFSLTSTVTVGIVSAINRQVAGLNMYQDFIQTDAAINPGNSGGALVNIAGEIVGINTLIYSQTGGYMGIGFAVPINMARQDAQDLIDKGRVIRGFIGISIQDIDPSTREVLGLGDKKGVLVADVVKGQGADRAGLTRGDVITRINDRDVSDANDLRNRIASTKPGTDITVLLWRKNEQKKVIVHVDERKGENYTKDHKNDDKKSSLEKKGSIFGLDLRTLTQEDRKRLGVPSDLQGVVVLGGGELLGDSRIRLQPGDLIFEIKIKNQDPQKVTSIDQLRKINDELKEGESIMLLVWRDGSTFFVSFTK